LLFPIRSHPVWIQSIGVTALVVVLEEARHRRLAFKVAIVLYLLAVLDMGINVCVSGVVGRGDIG